jgi:hypothetical protein
MLTLTYLALAVLGCGYVALAMLLGHFDFGADHGAPGGHHDPGATNSATYGVQHAGHGKVSAGDGAAAAFHFPFFSPLALATLAGSTGAVGLITRHGLGVRDEWSAVLSVAGALAITYTVTYAGWRVARSSRGTSTLRDADFVGLSAEILTPIPTDGLGEIATIVSGERFTGPARSSDGRALARGTSATIVRRVGSTFEVSAGAPAQGGKRG